MIRPIGALRLALGVVAVLTLVFTSLFNPPLLADSPELPPGWGSPVTEDEPPPLDEEPPPTSEESAPSATDDWSQPQPPDPDPTGPWFEAIPESPAPDPDPESPVPAPGPSTPANPSSSQPLGSLVPSSIDDGPSSIDDGPSSIDDGPSSIAMTMEASPNTVLETGGLVLFNIVIENTSTTDSIMIESIVDNVFGDVTTNCLPALPSWVRPEDSISCSFSEQVSGESASKHVNTLRAVGTDDDGQSTTAQGSAVVNVVAAVDLEVVVTAEQLTASVGEGAAWGVTVANRGPSEATGVWLSVVLPTDTDLVSDTCTVLIEWQSVLGGKSVPCGYDERTGYSTIPSIPAGGVFAMTLVTTVDAIGNLGAEAEVVAVNQADVDSYSADGGGDDFDSHAILVTRKLYGPPLRTGEPPHNVLTVWALAISIGVAGIALVRALQHEGRSRFLAWTSRIRVWQRLR